MFKKSAMASAIGFAKPYRRARDTRSGLSCLAIIGIVSLFPISALAVEPPKIQYINRSFAIDSCEESTAKNGNKILKGCNFFVRNYADAAMEVYDKGNKLIRVEQLAGARPATSMTESLYDGTIGTVLPLINSPYAWDDIRHPGGVMKQSNITHLDKDIVVPKGGKMVVTQNSNNAIVFNATGISIAWTSALLSSATGALLSKYMRDYPDVAVALSTEYAPAVAGLVATKETDARVWAKTLTFITIDVVADSIAEKLKDPLWAAEHGQTWLAAHVAFKDALGRVIALQKAAEIVAELLSTAGQVINLTNAIERKGTANDGTITYNNYDSLQPVNRFPDLAEPYYRRFYELELAGFALPAKNWDKPFDPEVFGAGERLSKKEFLRMMKEIMKKAGYPVSPSDSSYDHPYYKLYRQLSDSDSTTLANETVYSLLDKALNLAFSDNYALCAGTEPAKAFIRIKQGEDLFEHGYHNFIKQLYMAGIVLTNGLPTDGTVYISFITREESLPLYINLHNALARGKAKVCGV